MKNGKIFKNQSIIPLYLGITGHRDIRDEDRTTLKHLISEFIKKKLEQCPYTPVVLLTPLAEGADQIAAMAAIECKIKYIAVLPMPKEEYKKDFKTDEGLKNYNHFLSSAFSVIELPFLEELKNEKANELDWRKEQYYQNGLFIARQCHTLIALWDGFDSWNKGGTADIVKLKKSGIPGRFDDVSRKLHQRQTGPIFHIITPRISKSIPVNPLKTHNYYPTHYGKDYNLAKKTNDKFLMLIDSFNKDVAKYSPSLNEKVKTSICYLFKSNTEFKLSPGIQTIAERFAIAGELATLYQKRRILALRVLLSLVVFAFLFMQIYLEFYHKSVILLLYPLTMGIGAIWFLMAQKKRYEYKHEDYRALSEAYRVQFYLRVCRKKR